MPAQRKRQTPREIAKRLVQKYLNDCGGENSGFTFGEREDALAIAIARALMAERARRRKEVPDAER